MDEGHAGLRARLDAGLAEMGLDPDSTQRQRLIEYVQLLVRWNRAYNLTAVREPRDMIARHLLDSLSVSRFLCGEEVLDVGTGAGLPGIPLAIVEPRRRFVLLDSNGKKIRFVRQASLTLGLANVMPVQARWDAYRPSPKFATIVARAFGPLAELRALAAELGARPARLLAMKGRAPEAEMADPSLAEDELILHRLSVPFIEGDRHLIEVRFH